MNLKRVFFGEAIPDKDDPKYKDKHEKTKEAGMKFAQKLRLDKVAAWVQGFATKHPKLFLAISFSFVIFSVGLNLYRLTTAVASKNEPASAIERQEKELRLKRHGQHGLQHQKEDKDEPTNKIEQYEHFEHNQED